MSRTYYKSSYNRCYYRLEVLSDCILRDSEVRYGTKVITSSHPFNDVFKTFKFEHPELFIPLINDIMNTCYSGNEEISLLPTEGIFLTPTPEGTAGMAEKITDFLIKIGNKKYLIECQSEDDDTMSIRIAEYTFLSAIGTGEFFDGTYNIEMPNYTVLYVRTTKKTPRETKIRFTFPDGQAVDYNAPNILMTDFTKEEIIEKRLYVLIPYYILRYEKDIKEGKADLDVIEEDLKYFSDALIKELDSGRIGAVSEGDVRIFTNTIINHVFGKKAEEKERMVDIMGGNLIYTDFMRARDEGRLEGRLEGRAEGRLEGNREGRIIGRLEGKLESYNDIVKKGRITIKEAADELGMSVEEFNEQVSKLLA